jgi:drug/metabolite transporter (DMT)-like permease
VTLVQAQPVFVAVGAALLLDERIGRSKALGITVALVGMVVMSLGDFLTGTASGPRPLYGNALAIVGALMVAVYYLAGRSLRQRVPLIPYVVVVYSTCALALFAFVVGEALAGPMSLGSALFAYPPREWVLFLAMAVGPGIFGHTVINWALAHLESAVVSVSLLGEPVGSTVLAVLLLPDEVPGAFTVLGGAVVLAGIYVTTRARKTDPPDTDAAMVETTD